MLHGEQKDLFDLTFSVPAVCADRLAEGSAEIGIVPCAELGRLGLKIIPGSGIASDGPVRSILLVSEVPPEQIRTLAVDQSSRTSVMLARIILARKYRAEPALISMAPDLPAMLEQADAALIIGDPALHLDPATLPFHVLDLGTEWNSLTGLPMVFAVWAGRKEVVTDEVRTAFEKSCQFGLEHVHDIAQSAAAERGIPEQLARQYLTRHIVFRLGLREYAGMEKFLLYASELNAANVVGGVPA